MQPLNRITFAAIVICLLAGSTMGQEGESEGTATTRTMRPVVRGRHFAVASMKAEATRAAERILEKAATPLMQSSPDRRCSASLTRP